QVDSVCRQVRLSKLQSLGQSGLFRTGEKPLLNPHRHWQFASLTMGVCRILERFANQALLRRESRRLQDIVKKGRRKTHFPRADVKFPLCHSASFAPDIAQRRENSTSFVPPPDGSNFCLAALISPSRALNIFATSARS